MEESGTRTSAAEVLMRLDRSSRVPLRAQLEQALRELIRGRALPSDAVLPSARVLAADLGVSRRLVLEAYQQLAAEGYLSTAPRSTTRVAHVAAGEPFTASPEPARPARYDLRPRVPALDYFPRTAWARAYTAALRGMPDAALDYPDPRGAPELRACIADYLRRVRAVAADPDHVVICAGFTQALSLLTSALDRPLIAIEDPGLIGRDQIIAAAGGSHVPVPVDEQGLRAGHLTRCGAGAAVVTPTHQFPLGVALAAGRRTQLLNWARDGHLVIEDDYDAEYRYDRAPVGAMQGLAAEHVAYVGTVSKTLTPALRLGWLVLPSRLVGPVADAKRDHDAGSPVLDQHALARLIETGSYERHLRRVRRHYRERRDQMVAALRRYLPGGRISGMAAGLHLIVQLPGGPAASSIVAAAAQHGLALTSLGRYQLASSDTGGARIVLGYGNIATGAIGPAVQQLGEVIASASPNV